MTANRRRWLLAAVIAASVVAGGLGVDLVLPLPSGWFAAAPDRRVEDRRGNALATRPVLGRGHELWVELDDVAPVVVDALIVSEDHRFREHHGIDPRATARAVRAAVRAGRVVQGGSTLTQQTARLLAGRPGGLLGKLVEGWRALKLEAHLDKDEILTWYLNRAYFGRGSYGIEAAARRVFDESARSLSVAEAALLVGVLPAPERLHPEVDLAAAVSARDRVLDRMVQAGVVTADQVARARLEPIEIRRRPPPDHAPHLVARLLDAEPDTEIVRTTIDGELQGKVEDAVRRQLAELHGLQVDHAAVIVVDVRSAAVLAYVGSGGFALPDGQVDGVRAMRSPGSALKPFVYALALEDGVRPGDIVLDLPDRYATAAGSWAPENYDRRHRGPVRVREALGTSANLPAVRMLDRVGAGQLFDRLVAIGFRLDDAVQHYGLGLALGDAEVTLETLTAAYAGLARHGEWRPLRYHPDDAVGRPVPFVDPGVAAVVSDMLADPVARAPTFGRYGPLERPYWAAVKTGTSTGYRDNWTVGYTERYAVGVWVGNFDGRAMGDVSGVTGAGPLWASVMDAVTDRTSLPPGDPPGWERRRTCALSGGSAEPWCPHAVDDWAPVGSPDRPPCAWHREDGGVDWPPELASWARDQGALADPDPGTRRVAVDPGTRRVAVDPGTRSVPVDPAHATVDVAPGAVSIDYPPSGTVLYVDPRYPSDHQRIPLRAAAPAGVGEVEWRVDGVAVATAPVGQPSLWQPDRAGTFQIAVAVGGTVRDTVTVEVRGQP